MFICGILKALAIVRNIENLVKTAYFHFEISTGQTLDQYTASNILSAVIEPKLTDCHSISICIPLIHFMPLSPVFPDVDY